MMNCAGEELLRAMLDGELPEEISHELETHLATCENCRRRMEEMRVQTGMVDRALAALDPAPIKPELDAREAYARLQTRAGVNEDVWAHVPSGEKRLGGLRPALWAAMAAAVAVAVLLATFSPARVWAQKVLSMLRIQQVAVVPVDSSLLPTGNNGNQTAQMIQKLISSEVTVTIKPGPPRDVAGSAQASAMAGFPVRLFANRGSPAKLQVMGGAAANMILHRDRLQQILNSTGRTDLQIPKSADGAMVSVHIPKSVVAIYGHCPPQRGRGAVNTPKGSKEDYSSCVVLNQVPSPTVSVPPDLNLARLAQIGLEFSGMPAEQAADFCRTVDWTSTLVIPIPRNAGSYSDVEVDGVKGALLTRTAGRGLGYTLVWVKDGILYSIAGRGSSSEATLLGDSLGR